MNKIATKKDLEKYKYEKLDEVNKQYKKAGDKLWPTLERFHQGIVITARNQRVSIRKGKEYQESFENQIAKQVRCVKYRGIWVRTFFEEIPKVAQLCIDKHTEDEN